MENGSQLDHPQFTEPPMHTILQINSSLFGETGQSSKLAAEFAASLAPRGRPTRGP